MEIGELFERHHANNAGFCRHYLTLYSLVLGMETKSAFEFGSGFSSKVILYALKNTGGKLITCDVRPLNKMANFYGKGGMTEFPNWEYWQSKSSNIYKKLENKIFDFVLHDGAHDIATVQEDLNNVIPRMKINSILIIHDTEHPIKNFNLLQCIKNLKQKVSFVTLPYGYGLTIVRIEEDFGHGKIQIKWQKIT
jgi:predicted O-methyltransferase YrrM